MCLEKGSIHSMNREGAMHCVEGMEVLDVQQLPATCGYLN